MLSLTAERTTSLEFPVQFTGTGESLHSAVTHSLHNFSKGPCESCEFHEPAEWCVLWVSWPSWASLLQDALFQPEGNCYVTPTNLRCWVVLFTDSGQFFMNHLAWTFPCSPFRKSNGPSDNYMQNRGEWGQTWNIWVWVCHSEKLQYLSSCHFFFLPCSNARTICSYRALEI